MVGGESTDVFRENLAGVFADRNGEGGIDAADDIIDAARQLIDVRGLGQQDEFEKAERNVRNGFGNDNVRGSTRQSSNQRGSSGGGGGNRGGGNRQQQGPPPGEEAPYCEHGEMQWVTGGGTNGKRAWKAWMCPQPKDAHDKCDPEWVR